MTTASSLNSSHGCGQGHASATATPHSRPTSFASQQSSQSSASDADADMSNTSNISMDDSFQSNSTTKADNASLTANVQRGGGARLGVASGAPFPTTVARHNHHRQHNHQTTTIRSRLFEDDDDNEDDVTVTKSKKNDTGDSLPLSMSASSQQPYILPPPPTTALRSRGTPHRTISNTNTSNKPYVLKPLSLNLNFEGVSSNNNNANNTSTSYSSSSNESSPDRGRGTASAGGPNDGGMTTTTQQERKRRYGTAGPGGSSSRNPLDSPVGDMYTSPQTSPSGYYYGNTNTNSNFYRSPTTKYDHRTPIRVQRRSGGVGCMGTPAKGGLLPPPGVHHHYYHHQPLSTGGGALSSSCTSSNANTTSKSPRFRTLDGRIVESKNPFSPMIYADNGSACNSNGSGGNGGNGNGSDTPTASIMAARMACVNLGPGHSPVPPPMLSLEELKQKGTAGYFYNSHLLLRQKLQKRTAAHEHDVMNTNEDSIGGGTGGDSTMLMSDCTSTVATNNGGTPGVDTNSPNNDSSMDLMTSMTASPSDQYQNAASSSPASPPTSSAIGSECATLAVNALSAASAYQSTTDNGDDDSDASNLFGTSTWYTIRDGYPERTGRYSFTGSPIKESTMEYTAPVGRSVLRSPSGSSNDSGNEFYSLASHHHQQQKVCTNLHKVRRRSKEQDVSVAAEEQGMSTKKKTSRRGGLFVATSAGEGDSDFEDDNVSPTDVLSFPVLHASPSDTSTVPPAPCKKKPIRRPNVKRYTPIRKPVAPPQTPMPERHQHIRQRRLERSSSFEDDNELMDDADMSTPPSQHGTGLDFSSGTSNHQRHILPDSRSMAAATSSSGVSRFYSDFDVIAELGNGSFGNVFKVLSKVDGCMYAIKVAHRPAKGNADRDRMLKEVYALAALGNQSDTATFHIVRYHQAWMEDHRLYIQTELCTTTLQAELKLASPAALPIERQYKCLREILLALEFIHKNGMCHLDIKPENIFLKNDQFKLGDFGLVSKTSAHDVEEGDSRYMSLELLSGDHADLTKSDIFSLGMTMYEVSLGGNKVLPSNGPEWQALRSTGAPLLPGVPPELYDIIQQMLCHNFHDRPSAHELLQRPQLLSDDQKMLLRERNKVMQANMALAEQRNKMRDQVSGSGAAGPSTLPPMPRKTVLTRANTWNGF